LQNPKLLVKKYDQLDQNRPGVESSEQNTHVNDTMGSAAQYELPFKVRGSKLNNTFHLITLQLKNPDLLHNQSFVHGKWVKSKSGKTFEVAGQYTSVESFSDS
jgi:hypothetical protein